MKRFLSSVVLCLITIIGFSSRVSAEFSDVPTTAPYFSAVNYYEKMGIVEGQDGKFLPNEVVNRVAFLKVLMTPFDGGVDVSYIKIPYTDVLEQAWYAPLLKYALKKEVIHSSSEFGPAQGMSYLDGIRYVYAYYNNVLLPTDTQLINQYEDINKDAYSRYVPQIEKALQDKLVISTSSTTLGINRLMSRAEAVQMLYDAKRMYQFTQQKASTSLDSLFASLRPEMKELILQVYEQIHNNYLYQDLIDDQALLYATIVGMVQGLKDPYSIYFPPEASQSFLQQMQGSNIEGIGAYIEMVNGKIQIVSPIKDSPAEKAGILPGDIIISVDGLLTETMTLSDVMNKIRGPKSTHVKIEVSRTGEIKTLLFDIVRDSISIASVVYKAVGNNIAYFNIIQFTPTTPNEFLDLYTKNVINSPKGIIIDIRNNPGGYLISVIAFLGNFLTSDEIALRVRMHAITESLFSYGSGALKSIPIVLLMNKGSASAAEILAATLKDYKRATIIGTTSFGKGVVQQLYAFGDGSTLKLTVSEWLPPLSDSINKKGVTPDIEVLNDPKNSQEDRQLQKALETLQ